MNGTERDRAGNRKLHMDQYCLLVSMWLYNPVIDSLRGLQQAADLKKVQKRLGVGRASIGSLSESVTIFDPEPLAALAEELSDKLPDRTPEDFQVVDKRHHRRGRIRVPSANADCGVGLAAHRGRKIVLRVSVTRSIRSLQRHTESHRCDGSESQRRSRRTMCSGTYRQSGRCYLIDRGYEKYVLWNRIRAAGSEYVCRLRDKATYEVISENSLTEADRAANMVSDQIVQFGTPNSRTTRPDHPTRLIIVKIKPHDSRRSKNGVSGPSSDGYLRIVTNNLEIPAEIIAALYELRWTVELYFRIIKQLLGCRHLLSTDPNGVTIQIYLAIIACIMILAITGKMPTKRTYEMICFYLLGWASLDELETHIKKLQPKTS